ncbi:MAG: matrixin family metalloprotease [Pseudomonadota bacterium]
MRTVTGARVPARALFIASLLSMVLPLPAHGSDGEYRLLELDGYKVKWGEQELGVGASVSYAFADKTLQFANARNCRDLSPVKALSEKGLPRETLARETAAAFRVWEGAAGLSFYQVTDAQDADIVIGAQGQPRGRAFANVSYASGPKKEDVRAIDQALVCLNPDEEWKVGFDGDTDTYDIRYTLIHEIGHAIGLDHPGPSGQVMGFRYTETFDELQGGDLDGVRRLYGHDADNHSLANSVSPQSSGQYRANDLIGNAVMDTAEDEKIGSVSDLIIDRDGSVLAVVVDNFLGIGEKNITLPWNRVEMARDADEEEAVLRVNADEDDLDSAPAHGGAPTFPTSPDST